MIKVLNPRFPFIKIRGFHEWPLLPKEAWLTQQLMDAERFEVGEDEIPSFLRL